MIETWILTENVEGICTKENYVLREKLDDHAQDWAIDYRVIFKKKITVAETYLHLKTTLRVFQLYRVVKDLCAKYHIKIEGKKLIEGFIKKIGFIAGLHAEPASNEHYATQLVEINRCIRS